MPNDIHEKFLRLTGFEEDELPEYLPEWRKTSAKLGLTEDDIKFATEEWVPAHFDIQMKGIRKLLGAQVIEIIDLTQANEFKQKGIPITHFLVATFTLNLQFNSKKCRRINI